MSQAAKIRVDYDQLEQAIRILDEEADRHNELYLRLQRTLHELHEGSAGNWIDAFADEMERDVLPKQKHLEEALTAVREAIQKIIVVMSDAEDNAAAVFQGPLV